MFQRVLEKAVVGMSVLAGSSFVGLTLLVCVDVLNRNLKLVSMSWTLNVAEYLLYGMTFLGAPWVLLRGGHIVVDLLIQSLSTEWARRLRRLANAMGLLVCVIMFVYSVKSLIGSYSAGTLVYKSLIFPEWYLFTLAPITFGFLALIFLQWLFDPDSQQGNAGQGGL